MARPLLRRFVQYAPVARALDWCERLDSAHPRILRVLTYHRVDEGPPFARQMEALAAHHAPVSVERVLASLEGGRPLPPRAVLLTFDDAYTSFAEVAWPILRARGFPSVLFVPTAFPDAVRSAFWWDRLARAFARTERRTPLATPLGALPLSSPAERARSHDLVKRYAKELAHEHTLAFTEDVCAALGLAPERHEVLGWSELRALAREGVAIGAHSRTHPRLDRVPSAQARDEVLGSLADVEREIPDQPRLLAYPDGRFDDDLVALARAAGVELAFTTRRGTNDLESCDRLRLRRVHADAGDPVEVLRAKLTLSAARLEPATRLLVPPTRDERRAERAESRARRRSSYVLRPLDALVTAELRPAGGVLPTLRRVTSRSCANYERLGSLARLAPALGPRLRRALLDECRLPFAAVRVEPAGFGSGTTVFRLALPSADLYALKVYRRTLGRAPAHLALSARRYRARYRRLEAHFGALVLPAEFLVLHAPVLGAQAVACLQPWLAGELWDPLALSDEELRSRLAAAPGTAAQLEVFARGALAWREEGLFADLLGPRNLLVSEGSAGSRLWLIDYGLFHASELPAGTRARLVAVNERLEHLLGRTGDHVVAST